MKSTNPTHVPCTFCGAFSGNWCRNGHGKARFPVHVVRLKAHQTWLQKQKTDMTPPLLKIIDGACAACGHTEFLLAEDGTTYSSCEWNAKTKKFSRQYIGNPEPSDGEEAIRFFCTHCGARHEVPKELP